MGDWAIGLPFLVAGACDLVGSLCAWLVFRYSPEMQDGNGAAVDKGCVFVLFFP